jgi:hypothetical protein
MEVLELEDAVPEKAREQFGFRQRQKVQEGRKLGRSVGPGHRADGSVIPSNVEAEERG